MLAESGATHGGGSGAAKSGKAGLLALPETMDKDQEEQLQQQREMQRLEVCARGAGQPAGFVRVSSVTKSMRLCILPSNM